MRLQDEVALVTGSGRGIGRGVKERFAAEGARVVVNYHHGADAAEEVCRSIGDSGVQAVAIQAQVSRVEDTRRLVREAVDRMGRLDILVNIAGIEKASPIWEVSEEVDDAVLVVNLKRPFFTTQALVRHFPRVKPARQGDQYQLGPRRAAFPWLRFLRRSLGR